MSDTAPELPQPPPPPRGTQLFRDPGHVREDCKLVTRALREGWPISEETRKQVIEKMERILDTSDSGRDQIAASKVIIAADGLNVAREGHEKGAAGGDTYNTQINLNSLTKEELILLRDLKRRLASPG